MADNITLEEIPFGKLDEIALNNTDPEDYSLNIWGVCGKFLELCVLGLSLIAAILILYIILRFKSLRTRTNYYLMHYAIVNIIFIIGSPCFELLISLLIYHKSVSYSLICTFYKTDGISISLILTFGFLLGVDYFIACYFDKWLNTYEQIQKFLFIAIYVLCLVEFIIIVLPCFGNIRIFSNDIGIIIYGTYVFLLTLLHIVKCCKKPEKDCADLTYAWKMSSYIIYNWTPMLLFIFLLETLAPRSIALSDVFFFFMEFVLKLVMYSPPIVISFWLRTADKNFEKAYSLIFRKIARKYNQEEFNEEEDDGVDTNPILI